MTHPELIESMAAHGVPRHLRDGVAMFMLDGVEPGSFVMNVLCNDLRGAVLCGDPQSLAGLRAFVNWLVAEAPPASWGTEARYCAWSNARGWNGLSESEQRLARMTSL